MTWTSVSILILGSAAMATLLFCFLKKRTKYSIVGILGLFCIVAAFGLIIEGSHIRLSFRDFAIEMSRTVAREESNARELEEEILQKMELIEEEASQTIRNISSFKGAKP